MISLDPRSNHDKLIPRPQRHDDTTLLNETMTMQWQEKKGRPEPRTGAADNFPMFVP